MEKIITFAAHARTQAADSLFPSSTSAVQKDAEYLVWRLPLVLDVPESVELVLLAICSTCNRAAKTMSLQPNLPRVVTNLRGSVWILTQPPSDGNLPNALVQG